MPIMRVMPEGRKPVRRIRLEHKAHRDRDERDPVLPIDPRDPDVLRAKRAGHDSSKDRSRS